MVRVNCSAAGCQWQSEDRDTTTLGAVLAAELNNHTAMAHAVVAAAPGHGVARPGQTSIKRPDRPVMKEDDTVLVLLVLPTSDQYLYQ